MALRDFYWRGDKTPLFRARPHERARVADIDENGLLGILWRRKALILSVVLLSLLVGVAYVIVTPQRYLASASILIDPRLGKVVGTDPVVPGYIPDTAAMDSQIKLFTSQPVLSRAAKMAKLADDPEFNGSDRGLLDRLLHPRPVLIGSVDLKALENAITIKRPERTYVVQIDVLARDSEKSAAIANDIVQAYIDEQVASRVGSAEGDSHYVRDKLDKLSAEIRTADEKVEAYKIANNIVDSNGLRSNEQQIADLTRGLAEAQAKTSDAASRFAEIDRLAASGHLDASSQALNSLTIERLRQAQVEAEQSMGRLEMTLGPRHPEFLEAKGRIAKTNRLIHAELQRLKIAAQANYNSAKATEDQMVKQVAALKTSSTTMSEKLVPLQQLERNASVLRSSFNRFAQVNDNLAQQTGDSPPGRIINVARPAVSPARPKKTLVALISMAGGLFFGMAAALFAESVSAPSAPAHRQRVPAEWDPPPTPTRGPSRRYWDDDDP